MSRQMLKNTIKVKISCMSFGGMLVLHEKLDSHAV